MSYEDFRRPVHCQLPVGIGCEQKVDDCRDCPHCRFRRTPSITPQLIDAHMAEVNKLKREQDKETDSLRDALDKLAIMTQQSDIHEANCQTQMQRAEGAQKKLDFVEQVAEKLASHLAKYSDCPDEMICPHVFSVTPDECSECWLAWAKFQVTTPIVTNEPILVCDHAKGCPFTNCHHIMQHKEDGCVEILLCEFGDYTSTAFSCEPTCIPVEKANLEKGSHE